MAVFRTALYSCHVHSTLQYCTVDFQVGRRGLLPTQQAKGIRILHASCHRNRLTTVEDIKYCKVGHFLATPCTALILIFDNRPTGPQLQCLNTASVPAQTHWYSG